MRPSSPTKQAALKPLTRIRLWYAALLMIGAVFVIRLFYLQVIRHDHYQKAALSTQLKQYEIPAERGKILAKNGDQTTPIVLNEIRYTLYADPVYIENPAEAALAVQKAVGGNASDYEARMKTADSRYQVLMKKLTREQNEQIQALKLKGIGTQAANYRTYPQGSLAAQVLGFVNDEGNGTYGVEQALDSQLKGKPGELKAITDASGVPLAANGDNIQIEPEAGKQVVLTIDLGMQSQLEDILKTGLKHAVSASGGALIMEAKTGAIRAMANFPSYKPAEFYKESDASRFTNGTVSAPLEVGSIMKPLTAAAAINQGLVAPSTTYYDPSRFTIDGYTITNIEEDGGAGTRSVADILQLSLNTGATWLLMQMGGGEINEEARVRWHDYMTNHYQLGKLTGVEQGYEQGGTIPDPKDGFGLNIQYANTSFGQGMTATPLQMGAALASLVNGGTYYQPTLVDRYINADGSEEIQKPKVVKANTIKPGVSKQMVDLMENVVAKNYFIYSMKKPDPAYSIGGKTGTAQIANPAGGYYENRYNGMFMGFVGGDEVEYIIVVRVDDPKIAGYAGSQAAAPIFSSLSTMLINNFNVRPRS